MPLRQAGDYNPVDLVVRGTQPDPIVANSVRAALQRVDPGLPVADVTVMDHLIDRAVFGVPVRRLADWRLRRVRTGDRVARALCRDRSLGGAADARDGYSSRSRCLAAAPPAQRALADGAADPGGPGHRPAGGLEPGSGDPKPAVRCGAVDSGDVRGGGRSALRGRAVRRLSTGPPSVAHRSACRRCGRSDDAALEPVSACWSQRGRSPLPWGYDAWRSRTRSSRHKGRYRCPPRSVVGSASGQVPSWNGREEGEQVVVRRAGKVSSADAHRAVFPEGVPTRRTLADLKEGLRRSARERHARR